jgi:hypothetical protein
VLRDEAPLAPKWELAGIERCAREGAARLARLQAALDQASG